MELNELVIVVAGIVAALIAVMLGFVLALRSKDQALVSVVQALKDALSPALDALQKQADQMLAAYGTPLKPAHDAITIAQSLVDEPGDWLVKLIQSEPVVQAIRDALARFEQLTDGAPEEAAPLTERPTGPDV